MKRYSFLVITISILAMMAGAALADNPASMSVRAGNLIGAKAIDPDGQPLGTISDLVIAEDNRLSYLVVSNADDSAFVALPFTAASPRINPEREVVLSVTKEDFDRASSFADRTSPDISMKSDMARGYRPGHDGAWQASEFNHVNGIRTLNPYTF